MQKVFVQIGGSRDGRDPYLRAANRRRMQAVLIEKPAYLELRGVMQWPVFDRNLAHPSPADADTICQVILTLEGRVSLILAGFERYAQCAHEVSASAGLVPGGRTFDAPTKFEQRERLRQRAPHILQPHFWKLNPADPAGNHQIRYPAVLKPVNGGGGLCVYLVQNREQLANAARHGALQLNFDQSTFPEWLVEEYIDGPEHSIQGICRNGISEVLSVCSKLIRHEPLPEMEKVCGLREAAHIAVGKAGISEELARFAQDVIRAVGFWDGPYHIDYRLGLNGPVFIEMGFRISGGAVSDLVEQVSGFNWGDLVFAWMLGENPPPLVRQPVVCAANVIAFEESQISDALVADPALCLQIDHFISPTSILSSDVRDQLATDLSRHTGPRGRINITGCCTHRVCALVQRLSATHRKDLCHE